MGEWFDGGSLYHECKYIDHKICIIFVPVNKSIRRVVELEVCHHWQKISQSNMAAQKFFAPRKAEFFC